MTDAKDLDCRECSFWELGPLEDSELGKCSHAEVPGGLRGELIHPERVTPCRFFEPPVDDVERVERLLRCPRCMGDGKNYPEFPRENPQALDDEPCLDCQGKGEGNVDEFLSLYMLRASLWKKKADEFEAVLKRLARAKKDGLGELLQAADDQRLRRVEKAARDLVVELRQEDEPPEGLAPLEWALMGGDPEIEEGGP